MNSRGQFLIFTKFFQGGRSISIRIPEGKGGKGWRDFGRVVEELLHSDSTNSLKSKGVVNNDMYASNIDDRRSFADVVRSNKDSLIKGITGGIPGNGDRRFSKNILRKTINGGYVPTSLQETEKCCFWGILRMASRGDSGSQEEFLLEASG